jgi:hypothetical protein
LSVPERLTHDFQQALKLATLLDKALYVKEADLNACGIEALLENEEVALKYSTDKQKLDVVVAYLRRVHHYIYYAAVQCIDMGDIMHAHPALFCRPSPTTKDLEEEKVTSTSLQKTSWVVSNTERVYFIAGKEGIDWRSRRYVRI